MKRPTLSATVLTLNEEENLERCLRSLSFADEILVVDSGSTDGTLPIARRWADRVISRPWDGFRGQRDHAFSLCEGDWILFMDADEWIPEACAQEILEAIQDAPPDLGGMRLSRKNWMLGRWIEHVWSPDRTLRLFRRGVQKLGGFEPHVHIVMPEAYGVRDLENPFLHRAYASIQELVEKADQYSGLFARAPETDPLFRTHKILTSPMISLFKSYILKQGFRDGVQGHIIAWNTALYHFLKYAKKWEMLRGRNVVGSLPFATPTGVPKRRVRTRLPRERHHAVG